MATGAIKVWRNSDWITTAHIDAPPGFLQDQFQRRWTRDHPDLADFGQWLKSTDLAPVSGNHHGTYYFVLRDVANRVFNVAFLEVEWTSSGGSVTEYQSTVLF